MVAKQLQDMKLNEEQRENMTKFLEDKRKIIQHGELKEGDFVRLAELGYGNGGVVLKVEHKPSHIIMARKVGCHTYYILNQLSRSIMRKKLTVLTRRPHNLYLTKAETQLS